MADLEGLPWGGRQREAPIEREPFFRSPLEHLVAAPPPPPLPIQQRFFRFYPELRDLLDSDVSNGPGLAVAAIGDEAVRSKLFLSAGDEVATAVVGRHAKSEVALPGDPSVSLRHLLIMLYPTEPGGAIRFRVLDLLSSDGFSRQDGTTVRSLEAQGAAALGCGGSVIVLFGREQGSTASLGAEEAWNELTWYEPAVRTHGSPLSIPLVAEDEAPCVRLVVSSKYGEKTLSVGPKALRAGVMLGRAENCHGTPLLADANISRVHVLVVEIQGVLYAIDTASKNGVWTRRGIQRLFPLAEDSWVSLAGRARVSVRSIG